MKSFRLESTLAALLLIVVTGEGVAQAPRPAGQQPAQQGQAVQQFPQQQGQPLLVVPAAPAPAPAVLNINPELPTVELAPLLERVARASGKRFLVDPRLGPRIYLGGVEPNDVTYPVLLAIFRVLGFAAFESEGYVNVVPDAVVRFHAPIVPTDDASIPADLYVTRVMTAVNISTPQLIPILRPLLSPSAHLASHADTNRLIVMDRYENVRRITEIIRSLDVPTPAGD